VVYCPCSMPAVYNILKKLVTFLRVSEA